MGVIFLSPTHSRHSLSNLTKNDSASYTQPGMSSHFARTRTGMHTERPMPSQSMAYTDVLQVPVHQASEGKFTHLQTEGASYTRPGMSSRFARTRNGMHRATHAKPINGYTDVLRVPVHQASAGGGARHAVSWSSLQVRGRAFGEQGPSHRRGQLESQGGAVGMS